MINLIESIKYAERGRGSGQTYESTDLPVRHCTGSQRGTAVGTLGGQDAINHRRNRDDCIGND